MQEVPSIFWEIKLKMKMRTRSYICTPLFTPTHSRPSSTIYDHKRHTTPSPTLSTKEDTVDANAIREKGTIDLYIIHVHTSAFISPPSYTILHSEQWEGCQRCVNPHQLQPNRFNTLAVIFILPEESKEPATAKFILLLYFSQRPTRITESIKFAFRRKSSTS